MLAHGGELLTPVLVVTLAQHLAHFDPLQKCYRVTLYRRHGAQIPTSIVKCKRQGDPIWRC